MMKSGSLVPVKQRPKRGIFMSNTANPQAISEQDDEMLAEYDFSNGVRGKHRDRQLAPQLPGIQFLKNARGQKTAVLIDLALHQAIWQQAIANHPDQSDFQYLTDVESHTQSVFLDFKTNLPLWEIIYDRIIT
jgi:hypothetical protein